VTSKQARRGFWEAFDERVGISALKYDVPEHAQGIPYSLGGLSLVSFIILVLTGLYLAQFYSPMPEGARDSVIGILRDVRGGFFARNLHYWAANAMVLTVLLHMLRVLYTGAFKRPREFNWLIGLGLLATVLGFVFTGTVLKWDQEAMEALEHNEEIAGLLGGLGVWFSSEFTKNVPILTRLYVAHVSILPALFVLLFAVHAILIKLHGLAPSAFASQDATTRRTAGEPSKATFLEHLVVVGLYGLIGFGVLVFLAIAVPAQLGPAPVSGVEVTKPWWMFMPMFAVENWFGISGLFWASGAIFAALAIVPIVDRSPYLNPARRRGVIWAYGLLALLLIGLGIYAKVAPAAVHLGM